MAFGQVGGMGSYLISNNPRAYIFPIGQAEVFLRGDITKHRRTQPSDLCRSDGGGDVVVAWCNVGHEWAEGVERCIVTRLDLAFHILLNLVQRYVSRSFDESLYILFPGTENQLAQGVEFSKLCLIVGIGNAPWTQTVSQRYGHIVLGKNVADVVKVFVKKTFLIVDEAPLAHDASATAHDTAQPLVRQVDIMQADTGMDGEVIHPLFALLDEGVPIDFPSKVFHLAIDLLQCLIDGHGTHGYGAVADNPFAGFMDVIAGG